MASQWSCGLTSPLWPGFKAGLLNSSHAQSLSPSRKSCPMQEAGQIFGRVHGSPAWSQHLLKDPLLPCTEGTHGTSVSRDMPIWKWEYFESRGSLSPILPSYRCTQLSKDLENHKATQCHSVHLVIWCWLDDRYPAKLLYYCPSQLNGKRKY